MDGPEILIIDDDESIRETLMIFLEYEGYKVACAQNGRQGLDLVLEAKRKPRLIILDLMMPQMDGWQFLEAISSRGSDLRSIPVVVVTAFGDRTRGLRAQEIIKKPIDLDTLLRIVKAYSDGTPGGSENQSHVA